ncbi:type IV pilin protein [Pseudomonas jinjuensis]|nr:prepilin-type N-terminal cleavage/methylation domain-containing protein [Pseudomonas jinjuensis]
MQSGPTSHTGQAGFTLIELLIAMTIVGILAAIAVPAYDSHIARSRVRAAQVDLVALSMVIEADYQRSMAYPVGSFEGTAKVRERFGAWQPSEKTFSYSVTSSADAYTATATGLSGKLKGCSMTLDQEGTRTGNCPHVGGTDWQ